MIGDPSHFLIRIVFLLPAGIVALVAHEMAHAYAAVAQGDSSPRGQGRLGPDPRRHLEPLGLVMLALTGVGFGRPVQVNYSRLQSNLSRVVVALAGPVANLLLAGVTSIALRLLAPGTSMLHYLFLPCSLGMSPADLLATEVFYFYSVNLYLVVFNLLPVPGLDGFELLRTWLRTANPRLLFQVEMNRQSIVLVLLFIFLFLPGVLYTVMNFVVGPIATLLGVPLIRVCG